MAVRTLDISQVAFIVLREMRRPLMMLLIVYAIAVLGMTLIPGIEVDGEVQYMSIFHAFYFMTYTATTTGFGEIPLEFSEAQRMWAICCLYVSVIVWFYSIGSIVRLFQNTQFQRALAERRFAHEVARLSEDFVILCGYGDTGSLLARSLNDAEMPMVIVEKDVERVKSLFLRDYKVPTPSLCADASIPKHLIEAGIQRSNCRAVVAVTDNEEVNLKISAMAFLLNPKIQIITMSKVDIYERTMATLSPELHIVDPFKTFARGLSAAIYNPALYTLIEWLVGAPGASLDSAICAPKGHWVICGYGRLGHEVRAALANHRIPTTIIDPHEREEGIDEENYIVGRTTENTLKQAHIKDAVGILAGTDDDGHNLSILVNARSLNSDLFTIVRQNHHENEIAFNAADVDVIMQPSLVTARQIFFLLVAPLINDFFTYLIRHHSAANNLMGEVIFRLNEVVGGVRPQLSTVMLSQAKAGAAVKLMRAGTPLKIRDILRDPRNRDEELSLVPLVHLSGGKKTALPDERMLLKEDDSILFCGKETHVRLMDSLLNNEYALEYSLTGIDPPRGYFAKWFLRSFFIDKKQAQAGKAKY